jgi:Flp pilus assembly protein TadG
VIRRLVGRDEGGATLIEFALVLPFFILLSTGLIDISRAVWQENTLAYAAREGSRYASLHGEGSAAPVGPGNTAPVEEVVRRSAVGVHNVSVTVTWPDQVGCPVGDAGCSGPVTCTARHCRVAVDATAPFVPLPSQYLLGGALNITLRGGSMLVIQR